VQIVTILTNSQIRDRLETLPGWKHEGEFITKRFKFRTFMRGISFVNDLAAIAERLEHHPDIHIRWTEVTLQIQSHDEGGVTTRDFRLAGEIEKYLHQSPTRVKE
jgi:4a-hydroxytetrahydrobiopterin dehydratase